MRRFAAVVACLAVAVAASVPAPTPADAARKKLTLKQKKVRCLKKASKKRTRRARRAAVKRCRKRYAKRRPAAKAPVKKPTPAPGTAAPAPGGTPPTPSEPLARYVTVSAREFYFTLSRPVVGAGQVRVELRNQGEDPHDLVIERSGAEVGRWGEVGPNAVEVKTLSLSAGAYKLFCSLEGHEDIGMKATLRVEG